MEEADFTGASLIGANFTGAQLLSAIFDQTQLEKADFRTAVNFRIDPENNSLRGAKFSRFELEGLLSKYNLQIEG